MELKRKSMVDFRPKARKRIDEKEEKYA